MVDFGKINHEQQQAIFNALKNDGKIDSEEMKKLGLSDAEAKALNEAFSSGKIEEVGDLVSFNKSAEKKPKESESQSQSVWSTVKSVGKFVGGALTVGAGVATVAAVVASSPAWLPAAALTVVGGALFASCGEDGVLSKDVQIQAVNVPPQDNSDVVNAINKNTEAVNKNTDAINYWGEKLSLQQEVTNNLIAKLGDNFIAKVNQLIELAGDNKTSLDDIKKLLNNINSNIIANGEQAHVDANAILDAIKELGINQAENFNAILEAINKNGENSKAIKALLEQVLANQKTLIANNREGFIAVIEAIKNIDPSKEVDLSEIENLLAQLVGIGKTNGVKLDGLAKQNDVIITILNSFKADVDDKLKKANNYLAQLDANQKEIINFLSKLSAKADEIIAKMGQGSGCTLDFEKLMAKLQEILEAIKDHDVKVTVDVTGKVTCECNCNCSQPHEGIIGNLDDLLG